MDHEVDIAPRHVIPCWNYALDGGLHSGPGGLRPDTPTRLFEAPIVNLTRIWTYDRIPDKDRFVMVLEPEEQRKPWPGEVVLLVDRRSTWPAR